MASSPLSTPPCNNKSPVIRKNSIYFNIQVTLAAPPADKKSMSSVKLEAYCQALIKVIEALVQIDDTLAATVAQWANILICQGQIYWITLLHWVVWSLKYLSFFNEFHINKNSPSDM